MTSLYVSLTSFFASKVDESIGASYMALLWTITNMSGLICDTGAMWLTGKFEEFSGYIPNWDAYHYVLALLTIIRLEFKISFDDYFCRFKHFFSILSDPTIYARQTNCFQFIRRILRSS